MGEERSGVDGGSGLAWVKRGLVWMWWSGMGEERSGVNGVVIWCWGGGGQVCWKEGVRVCG
jgi:hypothetical protein